MQPTSMRVLFTREQIEERVLEMAAAISHDFRGESVLLIGVLKGAAIFLADLSRAIDLDASFDFIGVSSYVGTSSTGEVRVTKDLDQSARDRNVILVEDILDTGLTLSYLKKLVAAHEPRALKIAALLDKPSRRKLPITADYAGFTVGDEFLVGYGLDLGEQYRNLPDICVLPKI
jgi:hypoxanthine phosphoribosyltransferase